MATANSILKLFNNHLIDFINDVISIFPNNLDLRTGLTFVEGIKKVNPKKLIQVWKISIMDFYKEQIENNNYDFFLNKDYKEDLPVDHDNKLVDIIEDIKTLLKNTSKANQTKAMKYVQNLSKMSNLYFLQ